MRSGPRGFSGCQNKWAFSPPSGSPLAWRASLKAPRRAPFLSLFSSSPPLVRGGPAAALRAFRSPACESLVASRFLTAASRPPGKQREPGGGGRRRRKQEDPERGSSVARSAPGLRSPPRAGRPAAVPRAEQKRRLSLTLPPGARAGPVRPRALTPGRSPRFGFPQRSGRRGSLPRLPPPSPRSAAACTRRPGRRRNVEQEPSEVAVTAPPIPAVARAGQRSAALHPRLASPSSCPHRRCRGSPLLARPFPRNDFTPPMGRSYLSAARPAWLGLSEGKPPRRSRTAAPAWKRLARRKRRSRRRCCSGACLDRLTVLSAASRALPLGLAEGGNGGGAEASPREGGAGGEENGLKKSPEEAGARRRCFKSSRPPPSRCRRRRRRRSAQPPPPLPPLVRWKPRA